MAVDYTPTMKPYEKVGAFRYWCQTTLPLVYDDSKSYLELLYSVIHYLNSTISDVANMGDNIDALLEAYNQLQAYVNDYFDNLDVQEEINAKLDEMASDGTLDNLLEPFVQTFVGDWLGEHLTPTTPPIDKTLTIENAGADAKVVGDRLNTVNRQFINYGAFDISANSTKADKQMNGITFTWNEDGSCTVQGTSTSVSYCDIFFNASALPEGVSAGDTLYLEYNSDNNVSLIVYDYTGGSAVRLREEFTSYAVSIPSECTGLIIRLFVRSGITVNETIHPAIYNITARFAPLMMNVLLAEQNYTDADQIEENTICFVGQVSGQTVIDNVPNTGWLCTLITKTIRLQVLYPYEVNVPVKMRVKQTGGNYTEWKSTDMPIDSTLTISGAGADAKVVGDRLDSVDRQLINYGAFDISANSTKADKQMNGITFTWNEDGSCTVQGTSTGVAYCDIFFNASALPEGVRPGDSLYCDYNSAQNIFLITYDYSGGSLALLAERTKQYSVTIPDTTTGLIIRLWVGNGRTVNETVYPRIYNVTDRYTLLTLNIGSARFLYSDADDIDKNCTCFVELVNGQLTLANVPNTGWLDTVITESLRVQTLTPYEPQKQPIKHRVKMVGGTWSDWTPIADKALVSAVDNDTPSEVNITDMRELIQHNLDAYGYCKLGAGTYYVSDMIIMPDGSSLEGVGDKTVIRLMEKSGNVRYVLNMSSHCTVKNLMISGRHTDYTESDFGATSGSRYGIFYRKGGTDHTTPCDFCTIENVHIKNFTGAGIYQYDTGQNVQDGIFMSNVCISNCWCGLYIHSLSEFCRYVNMQITYCYYACINGGGNNAFDNCVFHAYNTALKIDGTKDNDGHGSCSNCSFCHTGANSGIGIDIDSVGNGFVFNACQVWYNSVRVTDSEGIVFNAVEFGRMTDSGMQTTITGGNTVMFIGCVYQNDVTYSPLFNITGNTKVKFVGCYGSTSGNVIQGV